MRTALGANQACPQVLSAEADACERSGGETLADAQCRHLCTSPIAGAEQVAGFDAANAVQIIRALPAGQACPQIATPLADACALAGGRLLRGVDCKELCSQPVAVD